MPLPTTAVKSDKFKTFENHSYKHYSSKRVRVNNIPLMFIVHVNKFLPWEKHFNSNQTIEVIHLEFQISGSCFTNGVLVRLPSFILIK